jgi:AraC-like DNA-binding protein/mannose-6-phosphate isomerase-like protein (cupin superfamily)
VDCFHISFDSSDENPSITPYFIIVPQELRTEFVKLNIDLAVSCLIRNPEEAAYNLRHILKKLDQMTMESSIAFATRNVDRMMRDIPRHFHYNEYQIDYFVSGSGTIFIENRWMEYSHGSICFIPPKVSHEIIFNQSSKVDNYSVKFKFSDDPSAPIPKDAFVVKVAEEKQPVVLALLKKIVGEFVMDLPVSPNRLINLISLINEIRNAPVPDNPHDAKLLHRVKQIVNANFSRDLRIADIAYQVGLSPEYLSRQFSKQMGQTLAAYINAQRLKSSFNMIQNTNMPLKQIAAECGFRNVNYFTTMFKKFFSVTPNYMRKQIKGDN